MALAFNISVPPLSDSAVVIVVELPEEVWLRLVLKHEWLDLSGPALAHHALIKFVVLDLELHWSEASGAVPLTNSEVEVLLELWSCWHILDHGLNSELINNADQFAHGVHKHLVGGGE